MSRERVRLLSLLFFWGGSTNNEGSWSLSKNTTDNVSYETIWTNASLLGSDASMMDVSNEAFMLLPQQLEKATQASSKAYIALKVDINATSGQKLYNNWAYIGIDTDWQMGKRYDYTLDFTNGAGQQQNGDPVLVLIKGTSSNSDPFEISFNFILYKKILVDSNGKWVYNIGPYSSFTPIRGLFYNCSSLTSLDLSHFDTSEVANMDVMFSGCYNLTTLDLSGWNTSSVTSMYSMFYNCSSLKTIRMKGCSQDTIDKIKAQLATDGITSCTIVTE